MRVRDLILALGLIVPSGCGGGGPPTTGGAVFTVVWPRSRLIPAASTSVKVELQRDSGLIASGVIVRPAGDGPASVEFEELPVGPLTAVVTAHPNVDGTGVAQASGSAELTVHAGQTTPFSATLITTIQRLEIFPPSADLSPGTSRQFTATARNGAGEIVLVAPQKLEWSSMIPDYAVVDSNGLVTAQTPGVTQVRVTEMETGWSSFAFVHVMSAP